MKREQNRFLYFVDFTFGPTMFEILTVLFESKESENNVKNSDRFSAHIL